MCSEIRLELAKWKTTKQRAHQQQPSATSLRQIGSLEYSVLLLLSQSNLDSCRTKQRATIKDLLRAPLHAYIYAILIKLIKHTMAHISSFIKISSSLPRRRSATRRPQDERFYAKKDMRIGRILNWFVSLRVLTMLCVKIKVLNECVSQMDISSMYEVRHYI